MYDKSSFQLWKNSDLPQIKKLLADEYVQDLPQSYDMFELLAQEQNFAYEFIQLPTMDEGKMTGVVSYEVIFFCKGQFNCYLKFVSLRFQFFMVMDKRLNKLDNAQPTWH